MKKLFLSLLVVLALVGCNNEKGGFVKSVISKNNQATSIAKLKKLIKDEGLTYFETIDHQANARSVKADLTPESVIIFGNPSMATALMRCNPSIGLDLPLRILVSTSYDGVTTLSYTNPEYWSLKHNIKDKKCLKILTKASIALDDLTAKASKK